ncbi:transcription antitermination factor NusB [Miniphocaeibacter halophilus]|uniref:Transcription antitermination factor NusB n=1 Tax=Miniphocaeibacter halophilus TaxID=2931922 RepID=A0AC61MSZ4_9FIRM|nr:transcription antitermination factor NusB [Miniphocaeibacter halophilus]QQK07549.1 transcription antitermination factor NusB [Miniphocaeibacter halophilus]
MSRKSAREWIVKYIFQATINEEYNNENFEKFCENFEINSNEKEFIEFSINSIFENLNIIDENIEINLIGWEFNRLSSIDKSILRVATNEILFNENIPNKVSINEAVEIAKRYSSDDAYRFINGVLGSISRKSLAE